MDGRGNGKLQGKQLFICRKNFALFLPIESVIPEQDFVENIKSRVALEEVKRQEQIRSEEMLARSMTYSADTSGKVCIYLSVFLAPKGCFISVLHLNM